MPCGTHACALCNAILFARKKKKQAAGPNCFGQILGVFCSYRTYISLKTARLAVTLGSLCRDRFEYIIIQVWAHCVQCTVSHARLCRVECDTFFLIQRTGRRSKLLGCNFELEDASSSPGKHFFFCFFLVRLFFAFHLLPFPPLPRLFFKCWCFSLKYYMIPVRVSYHVIGTARLSPQLAGLPCAGTGLRYVYSRQVGARVPFVTCACALLMHDVFFLSIKTRSACWSKYCLCATALEVGVDLSPGLIPSFSSILRSNSIFF